LVTVLESFLRGRYKDQYSPLPVGFPKNRNILPKQNFAEMKVHQNKILAKQFHQNETMPKQIFP
jgi:hypothetical protein